MKSLTFNKIHFEQQHTNGLISAYWKREDSCHPLLFAFPTSGF